MSVSKFSDAQFEAICGHWNSHTEALEELSRNLGKWLAIIAEAIGNQSLPRQPKQLEVKFVFKVADDHQDEPFSISIGTVTDAEGNPVTDPGALTVAVSSSDDNVVSVNFDPSTNAGSVHFGAPGVASVTAKVSNAKGDILGSGAADFTVTTGDPAAVSDVTLAFSGLTPEP